LKIIEIIGPPCSGKTYLRTSIKRKLNKEGVLIHTYKSLFFDYVFKEKDLSIIDRLTLCYFKFLKLKKEEPLIKNKKSKKNDTKLKFNNYISKFLYKNYFKYCFKYFPVWLFSHAATTSGAPSTTIVPPLSPPSGPISII